jgi:fused signal recognition particle receptor
MGFFNKIFGKKEKESLDEGLQKTKENFFSKVTKAIAGKSTVDEEVLDNLEEALVSADVGIDTTVEIIERIEARVAKDKYMSTSELNRLLQEEIEGLLVDAPSSNNYDFHSDLPVKPYVILVVGVNGVGKTTTIGKLAYNFKKAGKSVLLGAADTFRAAAVDQLTIWSERVDVPIVKQAMGSDPAAVAYDTAQSAVSRGTEVVLIDTAGRLHNKAHLMEELSKIRRSVQKVIPEGPHEVLLVLDGSTGQNALEQAKHFTAATDVSALAITKLDGTAKGGVVLAIASQFKIPVKFIGVGEKMEDLLVFDKHEFVDSLFNLEKS